jgi:putative endonuclease
LGRVGEQKAVDFLKDKGYKLLAKNFKTHIGEIDIIVKDGEYTVFVEVKTRLNDDFGAPSEAVTRKKQEKYFRVASEYLRNNKLTDSACRFDVVEIENGQINHIIDAFSM